MKNLLFFTNAQNILSEMAAGGASEYTERELLELSKVSRPGVNLGLRELMASGIVSRARKGGSYFYTLAHRDPAVRQLKVLLTVTRLKEVIEKLKGVSEKVILFGSASRGENAAGSDIDIFVVTNEPSESENILAGSGLRIQGITGSPAKYYMLGKKQPDFSKELERGIILWEKPEQSKS